MLKGMETTEPNAERKVDMVLAPAGLRVVPNPGAESQVIMVAVRKQAAVQKGTENGKIEKRLKK